MCVFMIFQKVPGCKDRFVSSVSFRMSLMLPLGVVVRMLVSFKGMVFLVVVSSINRFPSFTASTRTHH